MKIKKLRRADLVLAVVLGGLFFATPFAGALEFSMRQPLKGGYGFDNFVWFLENPDFGGYLLISLGLAVVSAVILLLLLVPIVIWINITGSRLRNALAVLTLLPLIVPVVALATGAQNSMPEWAQNDRMILAFFYAILALPYVYRTLDNGLSSIPLKSLTEASRSLGANWPVTVWRVVAPAVRTAVMGSVFLTLALSFGEYTITSLLHWDTFTTFVTNISQSNILGAIALSVFSLLSVLIFLLVIGAFVKPTKNSVVMEEN